ncbi:MAG: hypothetical protein ABSC16_02500 [Candidatus Dormibacteria bacterium]|jgi:Mn-dependent DtxR family transcriptional regulator
MAATADLTVFRLEDVARVLGCHPRTVRRRIADDYQLRDGLLVAGGRVIATRQAAYDFLARQLGIDPELAERDAEEEREREAAGRDAQAFQTFAIGLDEPIPEGAEVVGESRNVAGQVAGRICRRPWAVLDAIKKREAARGQADANRALGSADSFIRV